MQNQRLQSQNYERRCSSSTNQFFGVVPKPTGSRKTHRKDTDRLMAVYEEVHNFSLLDQSAQVERLKIHLINVGGKRRMTNAFYDRFWDTTFDDLSFLSD